MKHLTEKERFYIEKALKNKIPVKQIALELGKHESTVYREIKKGQVLQRMNDWSEEKSVYAYDAGQRVYTTNSHRKGRKKKLSPDDSFLQEVFRIVIDKKYSIEGALYRLDERKVCIKTLYNYVHCGYIKNVTANSLPYAHPKRKQGTRTAKQKYSEKRSIEERPAYIKERLCYGHWEMDTVYSSKDDKACLLVLSERMTREEILIKIKDRTAQSVVTALDRMERKMGSPDFRKKFLSITCDNGVEFSDWKGIERSCRNKRNRTIVYFCHPYCSGERGTNENINRMVRRWIPKGDDIGLYSDAEIEQIQNWINYYPRPLFHGLSSLQYREKLVPENVQK